MIYGNVINIQRYTIDDGPGIRTEIFMKGCSLSCRWCGNPEGLKSEMEPGVYVSRCIGKDRCGLCLSVCAEEGALEFEEGEDNNRKLISINRDICTGCMKCTEVCPADAVIQWGRTVTISEAMDIIERDRSFYEKSGGGVTVSGGEPLMQADFVAGLLKECRWRGIHTCLESAFCAEREIIDKVIVHADMLIADIKHMDMVKHEKYTGATGEIILQNLRYLSELDKPIIVRIPVIPKVNDDMTNMAATADFIIEGMGNRIEKLQLLGFMRLGEEKYRSLGLAYPMRELKYDREDFEERLKETVNYFNSRGINCEIGK